MLVVVLLAALSARSSPAAAQIDSCSDCHDVELAEGAVHEIFGCADCHSDVVDFPHAEDLLLGDQVCAQCHDAGEALDGSVHAGIADCQSCHGAAHEILPVSAAASPASQRQQMTTCGQCHEDELIQAFTGSVHGEALLKSGLASAPSCSGCHGAHDILSAADPGSRVSPPQVPDTCGDCHVYILEEWRELSAHGLAWQAGDETAPVCNTCHSSHEVAEPGWRWSEHVKPIVGTEWCEFHHAMYVLSGHMRVLMRDGETADPATWVGNTASTTTRRRAVVVAYRGAAATADQFAVENTSSSTSTSAVVQAPTLSNSDANAWRLAAFGLRDDTSTEGSMTANTSPPSSVPPIAYVGKGSNWWYGGALGSYTIYKPTGVTEDDLMIAFGSFSGTATPTAPTGWTQVRRTVQTNGNGDDHSGTVTFVVWKRTAGASEPSSWSASYTGSGTPLMTQAVAYRYCDDAANQFIDEDADTNNGNSVTTPTVTNTDSNAWRVSAFTFTTNYGQSTSSNEVKERTDNATDVGAHPDVQIGIYDSNGPVSTGSHSRWGSVTGYYSAWAAVF